MTFDPQRTSCFGRFGDSAPDTRRQDEGTAESPYWTLEGPNGEQYVAEKVNTKIIRNPGILVFALKERIHG